MTGIEARFGFAFADDHRAFLAGGLPTGGGWPDWRYGDAALLRSWLDRPTDPDEPLLDLPSRRVFEAGGNTVEVCGPYLYEEAAAVHAGYWGYRLLGSQEQ